MQYSDVARELLDMEREDQAMRDRAIKDDTVWDPEIDERNTARLREIIRAIGWPTVSKVGTEASHAAWLIAQHADKSPEFQREALRLLETEAEGEVRKQEIAYLTDRVLVNAGQPQRFGTQFFRFEDGLLQPRPIEDETKMHELRKNFELDTFEQNVARMQKYQ